MPLTRRHFVQTLFAASQTAVVGNLLSDAARAAVTLPPEPSLNFAIIGDWGRQGRTDQKQVAEQMGIACQKASVSFVVAVGDNFYERGVTSLDDDHWLRSFEQVYTAPSLQVPWYVILGNHDYVGKCQPQLDYAHSHPRWIMPARYYTHSFQVDPATTLDCFFIDTCPFIKEYHANPEFTSELAGQDSGKQLAWLEHSLAASKAHWKLVFGHHPVYSSGLAHGNQPEIIEHILPLLQRYGVQAYFAGHDHDLEHLKVGDVDLIVSGAGSEFRPVKEPGTSPFSRAVSGFALASMRTDSMRVRFIDNRGNELYAADVQRSGVTARPD